MNTDQLLQERSRTHGRFGDHAKITQDIKSVMDSNIATRTPLTLSQREALHMIAHKVGRILAGNPNHKDHWDDIAGYARLISMELEGCPQ